MTQLAQEFLGRTALKFKALFHNTTAVIYSIIIIELDNIISIYNIVLYR